MNYLLKPVLGNLFKQKAVYLLLGITLFPFLIIVASLIDTNFMQLTGNANSISILEFISAIVATQHQFIFPFIILAYLAANLFYDEIKSGRLILFKDTKRHKILSAKRAALFIVFLLYFALLCATVTVTYVAHLDHLAIATHTIFPASLLETQRVVLEILGYLFTELIALSLALTASTILTGGYTILIVIFYQLLSMLAPKLSTLRYFFPTGYKTLAESGDFAGNMLAICGILIVSLLISRWLAARIFKRIEY